MEKKNLEYLRLLRETMKSHGIDAVVVSGTDPHQSELPRHTGEVGNGSPDSGARTAQTALPWSLLTKLSAGPTPVISYRLPTNSKAPDSP